MVLLQALPLWVRIDLGVMAIKGYSIFPELEPHHPIQYHIWDTLLAEEYYLSIGCMQSTYSKPHQQDNFF